MGEIDPVAGLMDHVTAVEVKPVEVAVNCLVAPRERLVVDGDIEILGVWLTGGAVARSATIAVANFVGSAEDFAVTVMFCVDVLEAGAV